MKEIPHYCQNCRAGNYLGERTCRKCGTRLMLVVFPSSIRHDDGIVPSYYEDHLLERVTLLEVRLSQVAERLSLALDLMLRQNKNSHSDHILLSTLIDSLNTLGAVEKESLTKKWRKQIKKNSEINEENKTAKLLFELSQQVPDLKKDIFKKLVTEALKLLENQEEKQGIRALERALEIFPDNIRLLLFIAETYFQTDKSELAIEYLAKILQIDFENEKAKLLLGIIQADSLNIVEAKQNLQAIKTDSTQNFILNYVLGMISSFEKDWKTALNFFKTAFTANESPETHYLLGCVYFELQKFNSALRHLQKSVEMDTNFADAWFMLAVIYKLLGEETKSYQSIELAWSSRETGAKCLKFMKRGTQIQVESALQFLGLKDLKKNLIMNNSIRFTKLIRGEVTKLLND